MRSSSDTLSHLVGLLMMFISFQANGATLFGDDFNDGNAAGWIAANDGSSASAWQVVNGSYHQNNTVSATTQSFLRGTYAYYGNGLGLTDYELSANFIPLGTGSIGLMFRYQNNNNY